MMPNSTPPQLAIRASTFTFLVSGLIVAALGLTLVKNREFRTRNAYHHLLTVTVAAIIFVFPSIIYLRLALSTLSSDQHEWRTTRILLFVETGVQVYGLVILILLWILKHRTGPECFRRLNLANLHWYLDRATFDQAVETHGTDVVCGKKSKTTLEKVWEGCKKILKKCCQCPPRNVGGEAEQPTHFFKDDNNVRFWRANLAFFWYRYIFIDVFILFSLGYNIYITYNLYRMHIIPIVTLFADSMFFVVFGVTMILLSIWIWVNLSLWTALWHFGIILHVTLICYFICDTPVLASLLLGALIIFLSNLYEAVNDISVAKIYNIPRLLCQQGKSWGMEHPFDYFFREYGICYAQSAYSESQREEILKEVQEEIGSAIYILSRAYREAGCEIPELTEESGPGGVSKGPGHGVAVIPVAAGGNKKWTKLAKRRYYLKRSKADWERCSQESDNSQPVSKESV